MGRIGGNFRRNDMTLTVDRTRPGRDQYELSSLQERQWWTVNRHIRFAFGWDNTHPWTWNDEEKRPALHWEAGMSDVPAPTRQPRRGATAVQPPKEIHTAEELAAIGADPVTLKKNYLLMNDLTLENWTPIGKDRGAYTGAFNGNGYTVTILSFNTDTTQTRRAFATAGIGLFSVIGRGGTVENLHVTGDLSYDSGSRTLYMGAIAGENGGTIRCCISSAHLTVHGGRHTAGRGWGQLALSAAVSNRSQKNIIAYQNEACGGGITGLNKGTVLNCYSTGDVTVSGDGFKSAGGIVGRNGFGDSGTGAITQCYATGAIAAHGDIASRYAGGIAGLCMPGFLTRCAALNEHVETIGKSKGITISGDIGYISNMAYGAVGYDWHFDNRNHIIETFFRDDMVIYNEKDEDDEKENRNTGDKQSRFQPKHGEPLPHKLMRENRWWAGEAGKFYFPFGRDADAPWVWDDEEKLPFLYWELME
jgi:hypothetical protein